MDERKDYIVYFSIDGNDDAICTKKDWEVLKDAFQGNTDCVQVCFGGSDTLELDSPEQFFVFRTFPHDSNVGRRLLKLGYQRGECTIPFRIYHFESTLLFDLAHEL